MSNVVGIHIHSGIPGENSHVHYVDIIPTDTDTRIDLHSHAPLTGEITVDDLCPGAHDDGHDDGFENNGGHGISDDHDLDDVSAIHIHVGSSGHTGPHALNIFGNPAEDDADVTIDAEENMIIGTWGDDDENLTLSESERSKKLSDMLESLCSEELYIDVHSTGFLSGSIRGQILPSENSNICDSTNLISARIVSDNTIILEFDKPVTSDSISFDSIELPIGNLLDVDSISVHSSSYGHGIVIIEVLDSLHDEVSDGQFDLASLSDIFGNPFDSSIGQLSIDNALGFSPLVLSHDSPNLILSDDSGLQEILIEPGVDSILDLNYNLTTHTIGGMTTVVIPSDLNIVASQNTANEVQVTLPVGLEITGESSVFDGNILLPSIRQESGSDTCLPDFPEHELRISNCVEMAFLKMNYL